MLISRFLDSYVPHGFLVTKSQINRCLKTRNIFVRQYKTVLDSLIQLLRVEVFSVIALQSLPFYVYCNRKLRWRNALFVLNANSPRNFLVKPEAERNISDIVFGGSYRSILTVLITAVSKVENGDFLRNTARFYRPNFRVWSGKKWAVSIHPVDSSEPNVSTIQTKCLIVCINLTKPFKS